ncbi:MAG TPA: ATP-binding protein [Crinalium sp.]
MQEAPLPPNEADRLKTLYDYCILDTEPEAAFDDLTHLAARICDAPVALISLLDQHRQWFKAKIGIEATETPRRVAFCSHAILQSDIFIVPDALTDERFSDNPAVTNDPYVRFYAGVPLISPKGHAIGTICVVDFISRQLNPDQINALQTLGRQVIKELELRRKIVDLKSLTQEYQRSEASLRESEKRFRAIADSASVLIWVDDLDQHTIFLNQTWLDFTGRSLEQELGTGWQENVHPDDLENLSRCYANAFSAIQPYSQEYRLRRADREYRWMLETGVPRFLADRSFAGFTGSCVDIHDRKIAEENSQLLQTVTQAIAASHDFHSALGNALQTICEATHWDFGEAWIPNDDKTGMECSLAWYSTTDQTLEFRQQSESFAFPPGVGIPGRIWLSKQPEWHKDVSHESEQRYLRAQLALNVGLKAALGIPLIANDEVVAVFVFYRFEARDEDQRLIDLISVSTELGLFIQRKQAEEEIRKSLAKEQELNKLKSNFISIVSHEFRTPLTSIVMAAELLEKCGHEQTVEKRNHYFQQIRSSAKRMNRLIEDVLLISKGEGGKLAFHPQQMNLQEFCQELVDELQISVSSKHTLTFTCKEGLTHVYADANLLHHILNNLLSNAIKYSPDGGVVQFTLEQQGNFTQFQIKDAGIGIPAVDQQHLFEVFQRATNVAKIPGTGLGLSIVKQCVDLHGGEISVESTVNQGTTFTVSLPLSRDESGG